MRNNLSCSALLSGSPSPFKTWHLMLLLMLVLIRGCCGQAFAQSAGNQTGNLFLTLDFDDVVSGQNGRADPTALPFVEGLQFVPFRAVASEENPFQLSENPTSKAVFSFKGWPCDGMDYATQDCAQFYEFALIPQNGYRLHLAYVIFSAGRSLTGVRNYAVKSSLDGFQSCIPASYLGNSSAVSVLNGNSFAVDDVDAESGGHRVDLNASSSDEIRLRWYAWNAETKTGTFKVDHICFYGYVEKTDSDIPTNPTFSNEADSIPLTGSVFSESSILVQDVWTSELWSSESLLVRQQLALNRPYLQGYLNMCNLHAQAAVELRQWHLMVENLGGEDVSDRFDLYAQGQTEIGPQTDGSIQFQAVPKPSFEWAESDSFRLSGTVVYKDAFSGAEMTGILYPCTLALKTQGNVRMMGFLPLEGSEDMVVDIFNSGDDAFPGLILQNHWLDGHRDTVTCELAPGRCRKLSFPWRESHSYPDSLACCWSSDLLENSALLSRPEWHFVRHRIDTESGTRYLLDDNRDGISEGMMADNGQSFELQPFGVSEWGKTILPASDSLLELLVSANAAGSWKIADIPMLPSLSGRVVKSVVRSDGKPLPDGSAWVVDNRVFLLDSVSEEQTYTFGFSPLDLAPILTELHDSICLGDIYENHGFSISAQTLPGDFVFLDTLLAVNGADSIVSLALNVCDAPSSPEQIFGDSVIVRAGQYYYTISPVPQASFYVWSVYPQHWTFEGGGETVCVNIPYTGSGVISVKAVNRCGQSAEKELHLSPTDLSGVRPERLFIYPNPANQGFTLKTEGLVGKTVVAISDLNGKLLRSETIDVDSASQSFNFSLEGMSAGMYMITIVNDNKSRTEKLQKE